MKSNPAPLQVAGTVGYACKQFGTFLLFTGNYAAFMRRIRKAQR